MTVVAWDGKTLAADKQATCGGVAFTATKLRRLPGALLAWTGDQSAGELMAKWYEDGADVSKYPEVQRDKENWCRLIVVNTAGVWFYEMQPAPIRLEDPFSAWGSGRDFALAAMHLGKSAREAVEVACIFDIGCGRGVDSVTLAPLVAVEASA